MSQYFKVHPINPQLRLLNRAAEIVRAGGVIVYPTDSSYDGSSRNAIDAFKAALEEHGLRATVRLTRGRDIDAACGQLAAKTAAA